MLKLNLLPTSHRQKGTVQAAAFLVLIVWIVVLVGLALYAFTIHTRLLNDSQTAKDLMPKWDHMDQLEKAQAAYKADQTKISGDLDFLKAVIKEPADIVDVMRRVARATPPRGVAILSYDIVPGNPELKLSGVAIDYWAYNRWRLNLLQDPDFVGVPAMSGIRGGGSAPFPNGLFRQAIPVTVTLTLTDPVAVPTFVAPGGGGGGAGPGSSGGYPGGSGGSSGAYPGGSGGSSGAYPGGSGGSSGTSGAPAPTSK